MKNTTNLYDLIENPESLNENPELKELIKDFYEDYNRFQEYAKGLGREISETQIRQYIADKIAKHNVTTNLHKNYPLAKQLAATLAKAKEKDFRDPEQKKEFFSELTQVIEQIQNKHLEEANNIFQQIEVPSHIKTLCHTNHGRELVSLLLAAGCCIKP